MIKNKIILKSVKKNKSSYFLNPPAGIRQNWPFIKFTPNIFRGRRGVAGQTSFVGVRAFGRSTYRKSTYYVRFSNKIRKRTTPLVFRRKYLNNRRLKRSLSLTRRVSKGFNGRFCLLYNRLVRIANKQKQQKQLQRRFRHRRIFISSIRKAWYHRYVQRLFSLSFSKKKRWWSGIFLNKTQRRDAFVKLGKQIMIRRFRAQIRRREFLKLFRDWRFKKSSWFYVVKQKKKYKKKKQYYKNNAAYQKRLKLLRQKKARLRLEIKARKNNAAYQKRLKLLRQKKARLRKLIKRYRAYRTLKSRKLVVKLYRLYKILKLRRRRKLCRLLVKEIRSLRKCYRQLDNKKRRKLNPKGLVLKVCRVLLRKQKRKGLQKFKQQKRSKLRKIKFWVYLLKQHRLLKKKKTTRGAVSSLSTLVRKLTQVKKSCKFGLSQRGYKSLFRGFGFRFSEGFRRTSVSWFSKKVLFFRKTRTRQIFKMLKNSSKWDRARLFRIIKRTKKAWRFVYRFAKRSRRRAFAKQTRKIFFKLTRGFSLVRNFVTSQYTQQQTLTENQSLVENIFLATRKSFRVLSKKPESGFFFIFVARSLLKKGFAVRSYNSFFKHSFLNKLFFLQKSYEFVSRLLRLKFKTKLAFSTVNVLSAVNLIRFAKRRQLLLKKLYLVLSTQFRKPLLQFSVVNLQKINRVLGTFAVPGSLRLPFNSTFGVKNPVWAFVSPTYLSNFLSKFECFVEFKPWQKGGKTHLVPVFIRNQQRRKFWFLKMFRQAFTARLEHSVFEKAVFELSDFVVGAGLTLERFAQFRANVKTTHPYIKYFKFLF